MTTEQPVTLEDLKELLEDNLEATEENNRLLRAMRRDAFIGMVLKVLIWVLLIGGSFFFVAQFLAPYLAVLEGLQSAGQGMDFGALFERYREQFGY